MLDWLRGNKESGELPHYSRLKALPSRGLPPELQEREEGDYFHARRDLLERELLESPRRPPDDAPLFTELLVTDRGPVTIPLPKGGGQCLPVFSTPIRAEDYVRSLLARGPRVQYLSSNPSQLVGMLRDLTAAGVVNFTIDRCPRCSVFTAIDSNFMKAAADVVTAWAVGKATELARAELYLTHALKSARSGRLEEARDVALESVGHVSMEDPRPHLILGQLAVALGDRTLLREARAFLRFFCFVPWERKLDEVERSGSTDFAAPE